MKKNVKLMKKVGQDFSTAKRAVDSLVGTKDLLHAGKRIFQAVPPENMEQIMGMLQETGGRYREGRMSDHLKRGFLQGLLKGRGGAREGVSQATAIANVNPYRLAGSMYNIGTSPGLKDKAKKILDDRDQYGELIPNTIASLQTSARNAAADQVGTQVGIQTREGVATNAAKLTPALLKLLAKKINNATLLKLGGKAVLGGSALPLLVLGQAAGGVVDIARTPDYFGKLERDTQDWGEFYRSNDYKNLPTGIKRGAGMSKAFGLLNLPKAFYSGFRKLTDKAYGVKGGDTPYGQALRGASDMINPDMASGRWGRLENMKMKMLKKELETQRRARKWGA